MVIVIIGILAAVVGPRFFDRQVFDERLFFEESLAAVRYGQKLAVASGCPVRIRVPGPTVASSGYALHYAAACGAIGAGAAVADPMDRGRSYERALPSGVAIGQSLDITFNWLGCLSANSGCPAGTAVQSAMVGGFNLTVHAATGFIETAP